MKKQLILLSTFFLPAFSDSKHDDYNILSSVKNAYYKALEINKLICKSQIMAHKEMNKVRYGDDYNKLNFSEKLKKDADSALNALGFVIECAYAFASGYHSCCGCGVKSFF